MLMFDYLVRSRISCRVEMWSKKKQKFKKCIKKLQDRLVQIDWIGQVKKQSSMKQDEVITEM